MAVTIEKRAEKIPSCYVDKELLKDLGGILEKDKSLQNRLSYDLDTKTKDVKSANVADFIKTDWGTSINRISIETDSNNPRLKIEINFRQPKLSEYSLSGKDPTWVNGIRARIEEVFNKHRISYHQVPNIIILKLCLTTLIALGWAVPIFLLVQSLQTNPSLTITFVTLIGGYGALLIFILVDWLLPHFEYNGMPQKRVRKLISAILVGSGIIPSVILKLLGL